MRTLWNSLCSRTNKTHVQEHHKHYLTVEFTKSLHPSDKNLTHSRPSEHDWQVSTERIVCFFTSLRKIQEKLLLAPLSGHVCRRTETPHFFNCLSAVSASNWSSNDFFTECATIIAVKVRACLMHKIVFSGWSYRGWNTQFLLKNTFKKTKRLKNEAFPTFVVVIQILTWKSQSSTSADVIILSSSVFPASIYFNILLKQPESCNSQYFYINNGSNGQFFL